MDEKEKSEKTSVPAIEKYVHGVKFLCILHLFAGILSIIAGILQLSFAWDDIGWPISSGVGIWCGAVVAISAVLALMALKMNDGSFSDPTVMKLYIAHYALLCCTYSTCGMDIGWSAWIGVVCGKDDYPDWCKSDPAAAVGIAWINVTLALFMVILSVLIAYHYARIRRAICKTNEKSCCA